MASRDLPENWLDDVHSVRYWAMMLALPLLLAGVMLRAVPFAAPIPDYYTYAQEFARTGHIAAVFLPLEYSLLCGLSLRAHGIAGFFVMQLLTYLLIVPGVWGIARTLGASPRYALLAGLLAALYPQLFVSVTKLWDVNLAVLLVVAIVLGITLLHRFGIRPWLVAATGVSFGMGMAQRANLVLLLPLMVYILLSARISVARRVLALALGGVVASGTLIAINTAAHGSFFVAQNGPYNLVQGHNEFSNQVMLQDQTGEPTVALILAADNMPSVQFDKASPAMQHYYLHRTLAYARSHPAQEVMLTFTKLWTFLRPNTRIHPGRSLWTLPIFAMALVIPAWAVLLLWKRHLDAWDKLFLWTAFLYVLPFLLTVSDPRYQVPLDIVLLAPIALLIEQRRAGHVNFPNQRPNHP
jgi:4-amino-4-deoxy-L-arabinose transferase-like glycosyltransferase